LTVFGARIGKKVIIRPTVRTTYPWKLTIGDYSWIGDDVDLYTLGEIAIGSNAVVSQKAYLCTGSHDPSEVDFPIYTKPIIVQDQVWICADVFIMPGVTVGAGAMVAARSLVTLDVPPTMVAMGSPAKIVRSRKRADVP
jgi:putative colanic acid biosynthesis acetyltransferase WcaF